MSDPAITHTSAVDCASRPNPIPYMYWNDHVKAQRKLGLRQVYCTECMRWRFPDDRCNLFTPGKSRATR